MFVQLMLAFITVIGNREHDHDGDSLIKVYLCWSSAVSTCFNLHAVQISCRLKQGDKFNTVSPKVFKDDNMSDFWPQT